MRDKDKPFVVYRRGVGFTTIVPRGAKGWAQFAVWLALLVPLVVWFAKHVRTPRDGLEFGIAVVLFCTALIGWAVCCIWWMAVRAEVVDVGVMNRDRQRRKRNKQREL